MRAVQSARYGYIFNGWSDGETVIRLESQNGLTWNAMAAAGGSDDTIQSRVDHFSFRTPEEFYDYVQDPDALFNLDAQAVLDRNRAQARARLLAWMVRTGDPLRTEFETFLAANPLPSSDPAALSKHLEFDAATGETTLNFSSSSNLFYQVHASPDLTRWQPEGEPVVGNDGELSIPVPGPSSERHRMFFTLESYLDFSTFPQE